MESNPFVQLLFFVSLVYGSFAIVASALTCLLRKFLVMPILANGGVRTPLTIWKESAVWGFWLFWMYAIAIVLLIGYRSVFYLIRKLTRYDASASRFWNEKERRFLQSTPSSFLSYWIKDRFSKYYPEWKPPAT